MNATQASDRAVERRRARCVLREWLVDIGAAPDRPRHDSDCARHNAPAYAAGPCDCSVSRRFYLASFKDGRSAGRMTWWGPNDSGYTPYLEQAGIYTLEQIEAHPETYSAEYTVPVPIEFVRPHESRLVDTSHSRNRAFWSAADLRAAIADSKLRMSEGLSNES